MDNQPPIYSENGQLGSPVIEQALIAAVKRGVTVNLAMTDTPQFVAGFNTLAAGGVQVNLYAADAPLYIEAKTLSVNDDTSTSEASTHRPDPGGESDDLWLRVVR